MSAYEHQFNSRMDGSIEDYHVAPGGDGPLASEWKDKPHRLLYDVLGEVQWLRRQRMTNWEPIESAPMAERVLVWQANAPPDITVKACFATQDGDGWQDDHGIRLSRRFAPTHWTRVAGPESA